MRIYAAVVASMGYLAAAGIPVAASEAPVAAMGAEYLAAEPHPAALSIGILRDGVMHFHHFGAIEDGGAAPDDTTRYEIGSIAKTFTGLVLTRAVAAGKLGLDDDVRRYLDGGYPGLQFEGAPVRVRHLADMTSALPDNLPDLSALTPDPGRFKRARALAVYSKADFMRDLHKVSPGAKPGDGVGHSNAAAQLLIYILERACGAPYEELLAREIERPTGIAAAGQSPVPGYDAEGRVAAALPTSSFGWRYSPRDMLRYAALQLDERDPAVQASHEGSWFTLDRKNAIALPWIVTFLPDGQRRLHYSGGTFGFSSFMALYPERKLAIVLLANNASDTAQDRLGKIAERIAAIE
ncbi:serine hydrolase domain-containing protein [Sphingopyxis sp.]|uniref:serine hydrolase domain-containing protein n=1 Tax=Sphingopyxis sp. TaxID=1908224 RepID=UPI003D6D747D